MAYVTRRRGGETYPTPSTSAATAGALASAWAYNTEEVDVDSGGEVLATATITPASTGKVTVTGTGTVYNRSDSTANMWIFVTLGADNVALEEAIFLWGNAAQVMPTEQQLTFSFTVAIDMNTDEGSEPTIFPVGTPQVINVVGKLEEGDISAQQVNSFQINLQERSA
jgi:hypothetical protein